MIKNVIIDIKTEQSLDGQRDTVEFSTDGHLGIKDGSYFLSYDESGLLDSRMVIEKGVRNNCFYSTPVGNLTLGIFGEKVVSNLNENGGTISMTYLIDADAKHLSRNIVNIFVREVS